MACHIPCISCEISFIAIINICLEIIILFEVVNNQKDLFIIFTIEVIVSFATTTLYIGTNKSFHCT